MDILEAKDWLEKLMTFQQLRVDFESLQGNCEEIEIAIDTVITYLDKSVLGNIININGDCYYCHKPINNLSGNPNEWGIPLCHKDEPGKVKDHHIGCVSERLIENQTK